jgi:drug/metabolite transporter (DMT)-like permease
MPPMSIALPAAAPRTALGRLPLPLLVAAFCLIWSAAFAVSKLAILDCPPLLLISARCMLAGIVVLGAAALTGPRPRASGRDLALFALLGITNYALYLGCNCVGIRQGLSAGLAALIASATPVLTAVLAAAFLDEPLTWRKAGGLVLGLAGVAVVIESRITGGESAVGISLGIGALFALTGGTILFKRFVPAGSLVIGNGVQNLAGGIALVPFALASERIGDVVPSARLLVAFLFLALFASIGAYLLWFHLLSVAGATTASAYHFLMPPLGLLFAWLLLGERIEPFDLLGVLPVALGIWLVTHGAAAPPKRGDTR